MDPLRACDAHRGDRWIRGVFALTLVIFAALAVSSYLWLTSYVSNTRTVGVSSNLNLQLVDLVSSLKEIQRAAGGYVVAGDTAFLVPFREETAHVMLGFEGLRKTNDSSTEEQGQIEILRLTGERFIATAERAIDFMRKGEPDSARDIIRGREAKRAMERIIAVARDVEEGEKHRIAERRSEAESDFRRFVILRGLGTTLNVALIVGTFLFMNRQVRNGRSGAEALKMSEHRLQTVINSVQEGITFSNAGGKFEVFNQRMTEITGYTVEEANQAADFSSLIYPDHDDHQRALDGLKLVMENQGPHVSETTITTKSGAKKVLRTASQMLGETGREMFLTTYEDITEQERLEQALRESEEKLRLVFENAFDGISIIEEAADPMESTLVECNPRYAEMAGRSRSEMLEFGNTRRLNINLSKVEREYIEGGVAFRGSFRWERPDGKDNIIEYTGVPIEMRGKKYTIGIDRDVTEARRADQRVRESQHRYQHLFESSPIPLMIYDKETLAILEVNPATIDHYGYSRKEFLAMTVRDIRPPEDVPGFLAYIGTEADEGARTGTWRHRRKDGSIMQVEIKSHAVDWKGRSARLVLVHDVTDLLQIEGELRVQKAHFERLFESAPEGIAVLDGLGIVHDVNKTFVRMFGFPKEEIVGRDITEMTIPREGREDARTALDAVLSGVSVHLEARRLRSNGEQIDVSVIAVPVDNGQGTNMAYVLYRDITEKKREDREREDLIRQLQKALAEVKTLGGLLPICAWCKKIRDDQGYYHQIETFIANHSKATFTHGICPECRDKFDREAGIGVEPNEIHEVPT